jgi:hypothetical protein
MMRMTRLRCASIVAVADGPTTMVDSRCSTMAGPRTSLPGASA